MDFHPKFYNSSSIFKLIIWAAVLFSFQSGTTEAQQKINYFFQHIAQADGLLHNEVYSITQDKKGFIWIATSNGLQRYDGIRFVDYPDILSDSHGEFTFTAELRADKENNSLWVRKNLIIEKLELKNNHFTVYDFNKILRDSSFESSLYKGSDPRNWILSKNTLYTYDSITASATLQNISLFDSGACQASTLATEANGIYVWAIRGQEFYRFDKKNRVFQSNKSNPDHHPLLDWKFPANTPIRHIMIDSKQDIWITSWGDNFYKYEAATRKIKTYSLFKIKSGVNKAKKIGAEFLVSCMMEDSHHNMWIGTENAGLLRYNETKDNFDYTINDKNSSSNFLYNYKVYCLFEDNDENIWVGTDRGINIFNPYREYFKSIRHDEDKPGQGINKSEIISAIQTPGKDIYIGTWGGGIDVYDSNFHFKKNIIYKNPSENNYVWSFVQFDKETLWLGCQGGSLIKYNTVSGATQNSQPPEMEKSTIRCMAKDETGNIYFGLHNGKIVKWDAGSHRFISPTDNPKQGAGIINIFIDKSRHCWVSTESGFKQFDPQKMRFLNTWLPVKNNKSFSGITSEGIEEFNDSTLVIGSVYGGINIFNKKTKTFSNLTIKDGLPSNNVYAIKKDAEGFLWITSDYDLYKFRLGDKNFSRYSIEPGTINSSFQSPTFYPLQDGRWLTFTSTEALGFFPVQITDMNSEIIKTEITGFKLFGEALQIDSLLYNAKPIRLSYKENFFTIQFASLKFFNIRQNSFYYRLNGIDKNWVNGGNKGLANYTDVEPGEYDFYVKTENGNSVAAVTTFKIIIDPPFWKSWWFIACIFVACFTILYLFIKWRIKNIKTISTEKLKVQQLNAEHYKSELELEQIINYFSTSLIGKNSVNDVLWDVARNLIGKLGFVDCMMYLWNADKTKMVQKAGFGPKGSAEKIYTQPFDVLPGQGVVGYVIQTREAVLIPDTSRDSRYRPDEMTRLSELSVPVIYNNELIGVIDSEHHERNFFTRRHLQILNTIATLVAEKIKSIEAEQSLQSARIEMYSINEQLSKARLEALRSQMNPHFIFNCINSIDALIQSNDKYNATVYLNKFAKLIRGILDSSKQNTVSLANDLDTLKLYIELEQFRHEDKFIAEIDVDDELLKDDYKVPPLIIQPFVENAILHGLRYRNDQNGRLRVSVMRQKDHLQYVVEDNGVGRNTFNNHLQKNKQSYGIDMSSERVKLFNKEENASVRIIDLFANGSPSGTKVEVYLKKDLC